MGEGAESGGTEWRRKGSRVLGRKGSTSLADRALGRDAARCPIGFGRASLSEGARRARAHFVGDTLLVAPVQLSRPRAVPLITAREAATREAQSAKVKLTRVQIGKLQQGKRGERRFAARRNEEMGLAGTRLALRCGFTSVLA